MDLNADKVAHIAERFGYDEDIRKNYKSFIKLIVLSALAVFGSWAVGLITPYQASISLSAVFWIFALAIFLAQKDKPLSPLNPIFNSAAVGFAIAAFCVYKKYDLSLKIIGALSGGFLAVNVIYALTVLILPFKKTLSAANVLLSIGLIVLAGVRIGANPQIYVPTLFLAVFYFGIAIALAAYTFKPYINFKKCVCAGFTFAAVAVALAVLILISEGDAAGDFLDLDFGFSGSKKKKNK